MCVLVFFTDKTKNVSAVHDIKPQDIKGHISHLHWSNTGDIWASNDRGKLGLVDSNGISKRSIETCPTYSGHFALATVDSKEQIYWVHNEKGFIERDCENENETQTGNNSSKRKDIGRWQLTSIFFSDEENLLYVGKAIDNDAKITRYKMDLEKKDDIHRNSADNKKFFRYPAYLVTNSIGDLCVSDNNNRVIVVNKKKELRFEYIGDGQNGFTPYGICADSKGRILVVDSSSRCIHVINNEGQLICRNKVAEHLKEPRGLCIDNIGNCYIGAYGSILVYNFLSDDTESTT